MGTNHVRYYRQHDTAPVSDCAVAGYHCARRYLRCGLGKFRHNDQR
jgi:hypothetical protein